MSRHQELRENAKQISLSRIRAEKKALYEVEYKAYLTNGGTIDPRITLEEYMISRAADDGLFGAPGQLPAGF